MVKGFELLLLLFPLLISAAPQAAPQAATPTVTIASGVVIGTATRVSNQPSVTGLVNAYLGVPYAGKPERFGPPTARAAWTTPLKAQTQQPSCFQQFQGQPSGQSEDCLWLNVFAPQDASPSALKPVMFWIFGGNLQFGAASLEYYNGSSLAVTQDVVVVAVNYRTNIFGFSNSPEIPFGSQNSGFLDQRFALQWVQQNIAKFGGDPTKVLIFGESAGGESVKQLLANPPNPRPYYAAILESEQLGLGGSGRDTYNNVAAHFNCSTAASPLKCLRGVSAADIQAYISQNNLQFPPVANDGTYVTDVRPNINSGKFAKVPILIGSNLNEARSFLGSTGLQNSTFLVGEIFDQLGIKATDDQKRIIGQYAEPIVNDVFLLADRIGTDAGFTCPVSSLSNYLAFFGFSVWRYRYDASYPNTAFFPNSGAYHGAEVRQVFGTYPLPGVTPGEIKLSAYMQQVWAGMAKNPSAGPGWPRIGTAFGNELQLLGADGSDSVKISSTFAADYPCGVINPIDDILGLSWKA